MMRFPNIENFDKWNDYYEAENLENTNFSSFEDVDPRRPDAYIGFTSNIFPNPGYYFNNPDENTDLDWYD